MTYASLSTIAQLVCSSDAPVNFARLVGDLDAVLSRFSNASRQVTWDCDDVAIFDMPGTRILLGWTEDTGRGGCCLSVAVGPSPVPALPGSLDGNDGLCVRLVERVQARLSPHAVLWHQLDGIVTAETIDDLIDALPELDSFASETQPVAEAEMADEPAGHEADIPLVTLLQPAAEQPRPQTKSGRLPNLRRTNANRANAGRANAAKQAAGGAEGSKATAANDRPQLPRWHDAELGRLRAALYEAGADAGLSDCATPSNQMRLAVHAMNATLIVIYAPLGAAVMTYALLKGEDMKLSSRLMMLTGSFALMAQTTIGQSVVALAGV